MIEKLKQTLCKRTFLFLLIFSVLGPIIIGMFIQRQQEETVIPIAIVDSDYSTLSQKIVNGMKDHQRLKVIETTEKDANRLLAKNEVDSVYVIKEGFQHQLLMEQQKGTIEMEISSLSIASGIVREMMASTVVRITSSIKAANQVKSIYQREEIQGDDALDIWDNAYSYTEEQWFPTPLMTIDYVETTPANKNLLANEKEKVLNPYMGLWAFLAMISCFLLSDWIVNEKETIFPRVRCSYKGVGSYVVQTNGGFLFILILQATMTFILYRHFKLIDTGLTFLIAMILYLFFCLGISVAIAVSLKHVGTYYGMGVLVSLALAVFSGCFFPITDLLGDYKVLSDWLPAAVLLKSSISKDHLPQFLSLIVTSLLLWIYPIWRVKVDDNY